MKLCKNCNTQLKQKESECAVYVEKNSTLEAELEQIHHYCPLKMDKVKS